ncbi:unnamed protein product, partial [Meganyctiphanes norvegica]
VTRDVQRKSRSGLFVDYNHLSRVWTHPLMLLLSLQNLKENFSMCDLDHSSNDTAKEMSLSEDESETGGKRKHLTNLKRVKKIRKTHDMNNNYITENNSEEDNCNTCDTEIGSTVMDSSKEPKHCKGHILKNQENGYISSCGMAKSDLVPRDWWKSVLTENDIDYTDPNFMHQIEHSGKLMLLMDILRECSLIGEK